jgi:hypothetical protein
MTEAADAYEDRIAELYLLPPGDFTSARNALVKELKAEGAKEKGAEVGNLRKPTMAAWALNQLVRADPEGLEEFGRAVDRLRTAQDQAIAGDRTVDLRSALAERREHSARLLQSAGRVLRQSGRDPDAHLAALGATIEAAAADPEVGELLRTGRLTTERSAPGFDPGAWAVPVPSAPRADEVGEPARDRPRVSRGTAEAAKPDRAAIAAAGRELKATERRLKSIESDLDAARRMVDKLDTELRQARKAFTELDRAAQSARRDVDAARRRHDAVRNAG